jgi:DNA-binding transcriptional MerR regulator
MENNTLTIQQVAEATKLSGHTLRYYERIGLIHPIGRAENGHRRYSTNDIGWIDFLTKLRATGMSIQQMQQYAELQRQGDATLVQRIEMLKAHRCNVEARMNELHEHLKLISYKIEFYSELLKEKGAVGVQVER